MLIKGRVHLWASSDFEGPSIASAARYPFGDLKVVFTLKKIESYLGISQGTSNTIVARWQSAFSAMQQDGTISRIATEWAKILDIPITEKDGVITFADY